jgi:hypothetical protein
VAFHFSYFTEDFGDLLLVEAHAPWIRAAAVENRQRLARFLGGTWPS